MCGIICSSVVIAVGAILVVGSCVLSFVFVPEIIKNVIKGEVVLINDTIQMERFETVPFALRFSVRLFNLTNPDAVMTGGVPVLEEVGPYVYQLYQTRELKDMADDKVWYLRHEHFEFDPIASFPNKESDMVTIVNVPYNAIIQVAENMVPNLMFLFNQMLDGVFGDYNSPIATFNVRDLLFDGIPLCKDAGATAMIACSIIKQIGESSMNIEELEDGSLTFAILEYKDRYPSLLYEVNRGLSEPTLLGDIIRYNESSYFNYWTPYSDTEPGVCNMINGTDSGIFRPFVDRTKSIYAINTDICRSVELRYQYDTEYEGIPTVRYSANEWLFDNDEGCFCLNVTKGHTREDGCLLKGAMELFTCVGKYLPLFF
ncbi:sensory neuron membrane protein 2 [Trichoplusia ni]|uniref:Sensory neuron membrane protein 2 n=1 Tax=Trichoplusia ni TaxID=7111 RepID=A0A7E5VQC9_TRINI|nr:sensory neuron membrane protein 2 [Trichoplusia ni]